MNPNNRSLRIAVLSAFFILVMLSLAACQPKETSGVTSAPTMLSSATPTELPEPIPLPTQESPIASPPSLTSTTSGEVLRIMAMGDSITEGWCDTPDNCNYEEQNLPRDVPEVESCKTTSSYLNPGARSYREFLRDKLIVAGLNSIYVGSVSNVEGLAHEGHSAFKTVDLEYCIKNAKWLEQVKPDIILLHAGSTDALRGDSPQVIVANLKSLINSIYQALPGTTEVIVAQVVPTSEGVHVEWDDARPLVNDALTEYNKAIPGLVEEFRKAGKYISVVDMRNITKSSDEYDYLGVHPNAAVYERMAQIWFDKIIEILTEKK